MALGLWRHLESESGTRLVTTTGQVTFGDDLDVLVQALAKAGAPHETMSAPEVAARFPALSVTTPAVFEPQSGVIAADDCLAALARTPGVDIRRQTRVARIDDDGRGVRIVVDAPHHDSELRASGVIVCAGPWTAPLVSGLGVGLRPWPTLEQVAYLAPDDGRANTSAAGVPVFVERRHPWFYGLPDLASGLVKISLHGAGPAVDLDELHDQCGAGRPDDALVAALSHSARRLLRGWAPEPVATERCVYDNSPDGDFVLDRVGNVTVGSGTSGHGFKFAPLLGEVLADLATGVAPDSRFGAPDDLRRFASGRLRAMPRQGGPAVHP